MQYLRQQTEVKNSFFPGAAPCGHRSFGGSPLHHCIPYTGVSSKQLRSCTNCDKLRGGSNQARKRFTPKDTLEQFYLVFPINYEKYKMFHTLGESWAIEDSQSE